MSKEEIVKIVRVIKVEFYEFLHNSPLTQALRLR